MTLDLNQPHQSFVVTASAGSGKTHALLSRYLRLLVTTPNPAQILVVTFSRKSAQDVTRKIHELVRQAALGNQQEIEALLTRIGLTPSEKTILSLQSLYNKIYLGNQGLKIKTFHSFFLELVQTVPRGLGLALPGTVLDNPITLHDQVFNQLMQQPLRSEGSRHLLTLLIHVGGLFTTKKLLRQYLELRNTLALAQHAHGIGSLSYHWHKAGELFNTAVHREASRQFVFEYSDIELEAYGLLQHQDEFSYLYYTLYNRITHVLVDEFQDTNPLAWQCLHSLLSATMQQADDRGSRGFFIVGDNKQMIYSFRGALADMQPLAYLRLRESFGAESAELTTSHRCPTPILAFVNAVFSSCATLSSPSFTFSNHIASNPNKKGRVEIGHMFGDSAKQSKANAEQESMFVAKKIKDLVAGHMSIAGVAYRYSDVMILRKNRLRSQLLEKALAEVGVPFISDDEKNGYEDETVLALISLMRWVTRSTSTQANGSLLDFICSELAGLSQSNIQAILSLQELRIAQSETASSILLWDTLHLVVKQQANDLTLLLSTLEYCVSHWVEYTPHDLLTMVLAKLRFEERVYDFAPITPIAVAAFLDSALSFRQGRYPSMRDFLSYTEQLLELGALQLATPPTERDAVRILTIHAAKGLEAKVVFFMDVACPTEQGKYKTHLERNGLTISSVSLFDSNKPVTDKIKKNWEEAAMIELANLMYVALTRASELLILSAHYPSKRTEQSIQWFEFFKQSLPHPQEELSWGVGYGDTFVQGALSDMVSPTIGKLVAKRPTLRQKPIHAQTKPAVFSSRLEILALDRGTIMHRMLYLLSNPQAKLDLSTTQLKIYCQAVGNSEQEIAQLASQALAIINNPSFDWIFSKYKEAFKELPLYAESLGGKIIIDRLIVTDVAVYVIDFKTGVYRSEYRTQLEIYRSYVTYLYPNLPIHTGVLLIDSNRYLPFE
ncbi:MAG: UvrD-helicase domain-containing protein [Methylacidiphilales bacterium]|nr:UvrD-helicase domain-containing protein [Candidatus Methylacidiphilales bacterium]